MNIYLRTAVLAIAIATLCACGAKGELFMPKAEAAPLEMAPDEPEVDTSGAGVDTAIDTADARPDVEVEADADDADEAEEAAAPKTPGAGR